MQNGMFSLIERGIMRKSGKSFCKPLIIISNFNVQFIYRKFKTCADHKKKLNLLTNKKQLRALATITQTVTTQSVRK